MPHASTLRLAALCVFLSVGLGAFASASSGSSAAPVRATAPKLIAHDVSSFFPVRHSVAKLHVARQRVVRHRPTAAAARGKGRTRTLFSTPSLLHDFSAPSDLIIGAPSGLFISGDIGRTEYLQAIGSNYAIYSRVGGFLASVPDKAFWAGLGGSDAAQECSTSPSGQSAVAYDRAADRWVVAEPAGAVGDYVQCFAVSTTGDATGTWSRYVFQVSTRVMPDMLSLGVWPDGYYLAFNQTSSSGWAGAGALVVDRQSMLSNPGTEPEARYFDLSSVAPGLGGMRVATEESTFGPDPGAPELYAQVYDDPTDVNDRIELWGFHVDWSAPTSGSTFTRLASLAVPAFKTAAGDVAYTDPNATPPRLDTLPQLEGQLEYFHDNGVTQTLTLSDAQDSSGKLKVGWYRLQNAGSGWTVADNGPYGAPAAPSSAAAFDGTHVALAFPTVLGQNTVPGYTDPNDFSVGIQTVSGTPGGRSMSLTLDPLDGCTFWLTGTSVAAFSLSPCSSAALSDAPLLTADPRWTPGLVQEGVTTTRAFDGGFANASTVGEQWLLCDLDGLNCVPIAGATSGTYVPTFAEADGSHTLRFSNVAANSVGSSSAISSPAALIESIPPANSAVPVISGTAEAGQTLSTSNGAWTSSSPLHYTYRWQRCTGGTCSNITGATSSTYVLSAADEGSTIDVIVSATNTGGGVDAASVQTATVVPPAPVVTSTGGTTSSGGSSTGSTSSATSSSGTTSSSSGGGGGTGGTLNLSVTGSESPAAPVVGGQVLYALQVNSLVAGQLAQKVILKVTLPAGVTYASSQVDRGPGCTLSGTSDLSCNLDFLSDQARVGHVSIWANVNAPGTQTLTATVSTQQPESTLSDNTLTLTAGATFASTSTSKNTTGIPTGLNGRAKTVAGVDRVRPTARAIASSGKRGKVVKIRFRLYDNSGVAKAIATITRGRKVVGRVSTGFGPVAYGGVYYVAWHVPKKLAPGKYTLTVVAADRARHKSKPSHATLTVRR